MPSEFLLVEREAGVVVLTMNDPTTANAWNTTMGEDLLDELVRIESSSDDRVVILTGSGDRSFSSGANHRKMAQVGTIDKMETPAARHRDLGPLEEFEPPLSLVQEITWRLRKIPQPTIAAVNGAAVGGGMGLALACDFRIASVRARFMSAFVRRGIVPDEGSLYFLPQIVGFGMAMELLVTGRWIEAEESLRIGLVNRVVSTQELLPETRALARDIASYCPPVTVALIKGVMDRIQGLNFRESMRIVDSAFTIASRTEDHKEAVKAFSERRQPAFLGR